MAAAEGSTQRRAQRSRVRSASTQPRPLTPRARAPCPAVFGGAPRWHERGDGGDAVRPVSYEGLHKPGSDSGGWRRAPCAASAHFRSRSPRFGAGASGGAAPAVAASPARTVRTEATGGTWATAATSRRSPTRSAPFASTTARFANSLYQQSGTLTEPAQYDPQPVVHATGNVAALRSQCPRFVEPSCSESSPGPGAYESTRPPSPRPCLASWGKSPRFRNPTTRGPAPADYVVERFGDRAKPPHRAGPRGCVGFGSTALRL
eukprot:TRINITY_DN49924_c0_g1_i1.p1 TRINITY_DN49924_c0_g1~~TRINITY_DN49924_c0_g1_i1.p1  ORF type:complete len:283 (+),score=16.00 TRINITY_DN49924_c0_g1_i1:64-849(+)